MNRICCYSRQTLGCVGCGKCCGAWAVPVSEEERRKIMALPLVGLPLPVEQCFERRRGGWYLKKKNRHCIFLDEEKKCRIHTQFGLEAKPLTCRLYPPAGCVVVERRIGFGVAPLRLSRRSRRDWGGTAPIQSSDPPICRGAEEEKTLSRRRRVFSRDRSAGGALA